MSVQGNLLGDKQILEFNVLQPWASGAAVLHVLDVALLKHSWLLLVGCMVTIFDQFAWSQIGSLQRETHTHTVLQYPSLIYFNISTDYI